MKIGSLFSGYGGLDIACEEVFNAKTVWVSDIEPFANLILQERFNVPNVGDITKVDWSKVEPVDILCGGFPCQSVSHAGKREGLKNASKSGLWKEFERAIRHHRPSLVVVENVAGLFSANGNGLDSAFGEVLADLAKNGYDAEWSVLGACNAGLEHHRHRVFILAWRQSADYSECGWCEPQIDSDSRWQELQHPDGLCQEGLADPWGSGHEGMLAEEGQVARRIECDPRKFTPLSHFRGTVNEPSLGMDNAQYEELVEMVGEREAEALSRRVWKHRIMALGNGVVPAQAILALRVLKGRMCNGVPERGMGVPDSGTMSEADISEAT
jgi:DNA-cytosine methyltransferase